MDDSALWDSSCGAQISIQIEWLWVGDMCTCVGGGGGGLTDGTHTLVAAQVANLAVGLVSPVRLWAEVRASSSARLCGGTVQSPEAALIQRR